MGFESAKVLSLYKNLLRASQKFPQYNYRVYFCQRVRQGFKDAKELNNPETISHLISKAERDLECLKRQSVISSLYEDFPVVIDKGVI